MSESWRMRVRELFLAALVAGDVRLTVDSAVADKGVLAELAVGARRLDLVGVLCVLAAHECKVAAADIEPRVHRKLHAVWEASSCGSSDRGTTICVVRARV